MDEKEYSKKNDLEIDKEADFRAGGYHNTYSHEFADSQKKDKNSKNKKSDKELNENLKHKQNDKVPKPMNSAKSNKKENIATNKNYGWKEGFDRSESYGSELKEKPEVNAFEDRKDKLKD